MPFGAVARGAVLSLLLAVPAVEAQAELTPGDQQIYRDAFQSARAGDWAAAGSRLNAAHDPLLAKVLWWANLSRGSSGATFADFDEFLAKNPDWPGLLTLRQNAEQTMVGVSDRMLADYFSRFPPVTPAGKFKLGEIAIAAGREQEGIARIRDTWVRSDFTDFEEKTVLLRFQSYLSEADHRARLDRLLWDDQADEARRMLPLVDADHRALAEARLALAAQSSAVDKVLAKVPASLQNDPGLLFSRMRWRSRTGRYDEAIAVLEHPPADLVRPQAWATERDSLARHALASGDVSVAYRLAAHHGLATGQTYAELEFLAGWIALRYLREPDLAYNHFVRLYDDVKLPVSVARGAYWSARAADELGYRQLAAAWYSTAAAQVTTYYGQLAAAARGQGDLPRMVAEPRPTAAETAAFERRELARVITELGQVGAGDYAAPFAKRLSEQAQSPAEHALLARLVLRVDRLDLAISVAKKAGYAGVPLIEEGYPLPRLPPGGGAEQPLVLAMTRQESAFDHGAVSSAGALGMMQLMPSTARHEAKAMRLPYSANRLLGDSHYNIVLGRHYLDGLLDDFSGSYVLAIAAYNAGPGNVHRWIHEFGDPRNKGTDVIDWVESIPLNETRNYVQRVLENLQIYRLRLGNRNLAFSLASDLRR
jgi:soluble lytic murein transglycosylase